MDEEQEDAKASPRKSHSAESYLSSTYLKKTKDEETKITNSFFKARENKDLFTKDFSPLDHVGQPPRWPTECQVLEERIKHIPYKPCPPEPYYMPTGKEVQPKPVGEEVGLVVYQYYPISAVNYFCRSSVGGSKYLLPTSPSPEEESLRFESRFESGNLAKAIKITANYYELYLRTDLYTNKHMQWYYFRITNMKKNSLYRFSIVNLTKEDSLYGQGMRPLMYSLKDSHIHSIGWRRCGTNITYFSNDNVTSEDSDQTQYYTLSFTIEFPHDEDEVYLAHSYPYTYSDLQDYLLEISLHPIKSTYTTLRLLCKTLAGNNVYYVTITNPPSTEENLNRKKKAVVITARVHPGETPSSWMMHGFLDFLTSESSPAKELRDNFIFKLVPMLNPDGVIVGNNRCSLAGKDLNRQYRTVIRETYPSIWYTKLMIRRLMEECGVAMYCDLHAHSRKHNIFIFGCESRRTSDKKLYEQVFPLMLHKNASEKFSFQNCKFRIQKCKEGTGRVVMWMMGIANSFTMEASFGGTTLGTRSDTHFNTSDFEQMGKSFCETLLDFYDEDPRKEKLRNKILARLAKEGSNADEPANIKLSDYSTDGGDTSNSSDEDLSKRKVTTYTTTAPPPTPIKIRKSPNPKRVPPKITSCKSPARKTFEVCRANLAFSVDQERNKYLSETSSDSETDIKTEKTSKTRRRRKKKKKRTAVKKNGNIDVLENASQFMNEYSIIDINPDGKFESRILSRKEAPIPKLKFWPEKCFFDNTTFRCLVDCRKNNTRKKLDEVQAKLLSLKNKFWFGFGDIESQTPISWGFNNRQETRSPTGQKQSAKRNKANQKKGTTKIKEDQKEVVKKNKESLKRQTAIEFNPPIKATKLRKSKSLFENFKREPKYNRSNTYKGPHLKTFDPKIVEEIDTKDAALSKRKRKPKTAKGAKLKD